MSFHRRVQQDQAYLQRLSQGGRTLEVDGESLSITQVAAAAR